MLLILVVVLRMIYFVFFFKQKTAYEMRISDWSSDVCSSDLWKGGEIARSEKSDGAEIAQRECHGEGERHQERLHKHGAVDMVQFPPPGNAEASGKTAGYDARSGHGGSPHPDAERHGQQPVHPDDKKGRKRVSIDPGARQEHPTGDDKHRRGSREPTETE